MLFSVLRAVTYASPVIIREFAQGDLGGRKTGYFLLT